MDIKDAYIFKNMIFSSVLGRRAFCNVVILSFTFLKSLSTTLLGIGMSLKSIYVVFEAILCCLCPSNSALMPQLTEFSSSTSFCQVQSFNFKHFSCSFSSLANGYTPKMQFTMATSSCGHATISAFGDKYCSNAPPKSKRSLSKSIQTSY